MKKFLLAALFMTIGLTAAQAQYQRRREVDRRDEVEKRKNKYSGFYGRIGIGYAFPQAGQTIDGYGNIYSGSTNTTTGNGTSTTSKTASFSSGIQGTIAGGYMIGKHLGIDLALGYGIHNTHYTYDEPNTTFNSVNGSLTNTIHGYNMLIAMPSMVVQTGSDIINLYVRAGVALPIISKLKNTQEFINAPGTGADEDQIYSFDTKTYFGVGLTGAVGIKYRIADKINIWGEVNALSMSLYVKQQYLTDLTVNGTSYISQVSSADRTINFSKSTNSSNTNQYLTYSMPYSNIGLQVGISFGL